MQKWNLNKSILFELKVVSLSFAIMSDNICENEVGSFKYQTLRVTNKFAILLWA